MLVKYFVIEDVLHLQQEWLFARAVHNLSGAQVENSLIRR